ncbi:hypothetical protein JCM8097_008563 [Rhodosporidiobolus ruineniae]
MPARPPTHPTPSQDDHGPVLLLPALPHRHQAAPWLAQWTRTGETELVGYQVWAIEQWVTDRHAVLPVIVVLTGDKTDCISVERFELRGAASLKRELRDRLWDETKAVLKQHGARFNETEQGAIPITALPSLPPSLSLVQVPGGDYRDVVLQLYQNINLRRPAQQLHFRQSYRLPMPPPSSTSSSSSTAVPPFTHTLLSLITLVQHALSLFGLGPVKAFLAPAVLAQLPSSLTAASIPAPANGSALLELLDRTLLDSLLHSTPPDGTSEAAPEDWADALCMPLALFDAQRDAHDAVSRAGGACAPLLEGDGLLCDTTVSALALFRVEYAARLLGSQQQATASHPTVTSAAVGALARDEAVLSPGLLAALLSLAIGARGKMLALGGGGTEGIPKDVFERRGRFLAAVGQFQKSHSSPSTTPPVLSPSFLTWLNATYTAKFHPSGPSSSLSSPLSTLRGGLTTLAAQIPSLHSRHHPGSGASTPGGGSEAEGSDAGAHTSHSRTSTLRRKSHGGHHHHPHLERLLHGGRGSKGEEAETADLERFVHDVLAGGVGGGGKARGLGGRSARAVWGYGGGGVREVTEDAGAAEKEQNGERGRRRSGRRERRRAEKAARKGGEGEEEKEVLGGEGGEDDPDEGRPNSETGARGGTAGDSALGSPTLSRVTTAATSGTVGTSGTATTTATGGGSLRGPVSLGKGVLRGVKDRAGRAKRRMEDGLGLNDSNSDKLVSADAGGDSNAKLLAPQVVVSPDSGDRSPARSANGERDDEIEGAGTASRAATLASKLASVLTPPQLNLPISSSSRSASSSLHPSPSSSPRPPQGERTALAPLETKNLSLSRSRSPGNSRRGSAAHSPVSASGKGSPATLLAPSPLIVGGSGAEGASLGLGPPPLLAVKKPLGPRRTVSEMPTWAVEEKLEAEGKRVGRSLLFGGGEATTEEEGESGEEAVVDEEGNALGEDGPRLTHSPLAVTPAASPSPSPSPSPGNSRRPSGLPSSSRRRRHSLSVPVEHPQAPEPFVYLSRRRMELEVNLRFAAWELRRRERGLEEGRKGLEAIHRSYTKAISSLQPHLDSKTAQLSSLSARAADLTARLDALSSSSSSPLTKLSTGTSRLHYAQAVLDDKLRDVLEFRRMLEAKVGPQGSLEKAASALAGERTGMRRLVKVLEKWTEWVEYLGWRAGCWVGIGGAKKEEEKRKEEDEGEVTAEGE